MNNNETRPLNTNDGWESIVNSNAVQRSFARERVAAQKMERKRRKLLLTVYVLAAAGLAAVILGSVGSMAAWLTAIASSIFLYVACIQFGRYLEVKKK